MKTLFKNKKILIGVTGSIAAYKTPLLIRELIKLGAHVNVIMTPSAKEFVTPLTLTNVSRNPVAIEMFDESMQTGGAWHIQLAHWCDAMFIAPCSASTLGKIANGIADTALVTVATALPQEVPLVLAPSMDSTMWLHPSTQRNASIAQKDGAILVPPGEGELSSGLVGPGRLPEIPVLLDYLGKAINGWMADSIDPNDSISSQILDYDKKMDDYKSKISRPTLDDTNDDVKLSASINLEELKKKRLGKSPNENLLKGKKVIITAGPTYERIDEVRFLGNHSSGKMGYSIAAMARKAGANVVLITGPVSINPPEGVKCIEVCTAQEMYDVAVEEYYDADIAIMSAAVADYTLKKPFDGKIKKKDLGNKLVLELDVTKDILAHLGKIKKPNQTLIGFALEAVNELEYGRQKMKNKNCDMIVINSASRPQSGFGGDANTITILTDQGYEESFPAMRKTECAKIIIERISKIQ